jgi:hypothetical protein
MIELEKFQAHIETLKTTDWERLFSLLPEIEVSKNNREINSSEKLIDGAIPFPNVNSSMIINKVFNLIHELNLVPAFDWTSWEEGINILNNHEFDYAKLDTITLCKLLTTIIRADRFNDGFLVSCFENGIVSKIIKALNQHEIHQRKTSP